MTDAASQITQYGYDQVGNRTHTTDANTHTTTFNFDLLHRMTERKLPLGMAETMTYDAVGNRQNMTDFNGKTTTYTYDALNRLRVTQPDARFNAPSVVFTYTPTGQRTTLVDAVGTTTYTYDTHDRVVSKATPQGTLTYTYDEQGNVRSLRSSHTNGVAVDYTYDVLNRLATVQDTRLSSGTTTYRYDAVGNLDRMQYPNNVQTAYTYDSLNHLTKLDIQASTLFNRYTYTLGKAGNRLKQEELNGRTVNYQYDSTYRLLNENVSVDPAGSTGSITYAYDQTANRQSRTSTLTGVPTQSYSYDANDRLTSDSYDGNGNTLASGGTTYQYDFENRLVGQNNGAVASPMMAMATASARPSQAAPHSTSWMIVTRLATRRWWKNWSMAPCSAPTPMALPD